MPTKRCRLYKSEDIRGSNDEIKLLRRREKRERREREEREEMR